MLLYITIGILFTYTLVLIGFFMGWCTLIPTRCHPRREIPFSSVKSPRRNTKFGEVDSVSSSASIDLGKPAVAPCPKKGFSMLKKHSLSPEPTNKPVNDYLHPKYSLPPVKLDFVEQKVQWEFEHLLRTPARTPKHQETTHSALNNNATAPIHVPVPSCS